MEFNKASYVEKLGLNPNWFLAMLICLSKKSIMRLWSNFSIILVKTGKKEVLAYIYQDLFLFHFYELVLLWLLSDRLEKQFS